MTPGQVLASVKYGKTLPRRCVCFKGEPELMVTRAPRFQTPGRLLSILSIHKLRLRDVKWLVQDHRAFRAEPKAVFSESVSMVWSQAASSKDQ